MNFVAEWFSLEEMKALQGVCVLTLVWAREWQYKDILTEFDDQVWKTFRKNVNSISQKKKKVLPCDGAVVMFGNAKRRLYVHATNAV